ncbi:MAG: sulfatase [Verrucomicrobiota bacterium]
MKRLFSSILAALALAFIAQGNEKPNVLFIVCDDLNDYVETLGGHPQTATPHIKSLIDSGVSFTQAHCNIPICNPSRASFITGILPKTSQCFGFDDWDSFEVLKNSRTMMKHFELNGYHTLGTGKVMHNRDKDEWLEYGHQSDYGPFASVDGKKSLPHPDTPQPFRDDFGSIDGSYGPLYHLNGKKDKDGNTIMWQTGPWNGKRELKYVSEDDRDLTGDELNSQWAVKRLKELAAETDGKPFFMGVGFVRPHTPLIVPQTYFDRFPLDSIELPEIKENDAEDTFKATIQSDEDDRSGDRGTKMFDSLVQSYDGDRELALKKFIQAYLASVASVDDLVGDILSALETTGLDKNTIVIFTSDHGWGMGEKDYLYKNSLWQESTRVPLIIRAPGVSQAGAEVDEAVSLVDLFPTLNDLCGLPSDTKKNDQGTELDGFSMKPLLANPEKGEWDGPEAAMIALYKWSDYYDPAFQSYSLRSKDWRYIRYENGKEELYNCAEDPHEWTNLALDSEYADTLAQWRKKLDAQVPESKPKPKQTADQWKDEYFKKNPKADANKDGKLTWPEFKAYKAEEDAAKAK